MGKLSNMMYMVDLLNTGNIYTIKELVKKIYDAKMINIFRGDYVNSACYDLESKIIESGLFNCIIHEKKNFSHG